MKNKKIKSKIYYASDLHIDSSENYINTLMQIDLSNITKEDYLILAGDILSFELIKTDSFKFKVLSDTFKKVFIIPGNHEYYNVNWNDPLPVITEYTNIEYINNELFSINDKLFYGSTLWCNPKNKETEHAFNDFYRIKTDNNHTRLTIEDMSEMHKYCLNKLVEAISTGQKMTIITHHAPTKEKYPKKYAKSIHNDFFVNELDDLIIANPHIENWIFGHTHSGTTKCKIGETNVVCNQFGHKREREGKSVFKLKELKF